MTLIRTIEKFFAVISIYLFTDAIIGVIRDGQSDSGRLLSPAAILFHSIHLISIILILVKQKNISSAFKKSKLLWLLVIFILLSSIWSISPNATLIANIKFLRLTTFGLYVATSFTMKEQFKLLAWSLALAALSSLICSIFFPEYGLMGGELATDKLMADQGESHLGSWQGVYSHKNMLGRFMSLGVIVFFLIATSNQVWSIIGWVGVAISFTLIILSTSSSALVITVVILSLVPIYKIFRLKPNIAIPAMTFISCLIGGIFSILWTQQNAIFNALGKDPTLTGRSDIWDTVMDQIYQRLLIGYGYQAFWNDDNQKATSIWSSLGWEFRHAHNGYIDLMLDIGIIGLIIFIIGICFNLAKAIQYVHQNKTSVGLFPIAFLTFILIANITESVILRPSAIWLIYVIVTISLSLKEEYVSKSPLQTQFAGIDRKPPNLKHKHS